MRLRSNGATPGEGADIGGTRWGSYESRILVFCCLKASSTDSAIGWSSLIEIEPTLLREIMPPIIALSLIFWWEDYIDLSYDGVLDYLMIYLVLIFRFHYNKAYIPQKVRCGTGSQCQGNRMTGRHRWGHQRKSDKLRLLIQIEPGHGIRRGSVLPLILKFPPFALNVNPCKSMIKTGNSRLLQNIINLWKNEVRLKHVAWIKITGFAGIVFYLYYS